MTMFAFAIISFVIGASVMAVVSIKPQQHCVSCSYRKLCAQAAEGHYCAKHKPLEG